MNYHDIKKTDMLNGDGLRVVLFVSGCNHCCYGCHNPETWDSNSGILFDEKAKKEVYSELEKDYISGITLSGGDPLNKANLSGILCLVKDIKEKFKEKDIWLYTGYTFEELTKPSDSPEMLMRKEILKYCDVLVDGRFEKDKADIEYPYAGSTNQQIIHLKNVTY